MEVEQQMGQVPLPRFGHTCTLIGGARVVLFGGATGDTGRYNITDDTYVLDVESNMWKRVDMRKDSSAPSPRAAHAAVCVDHMQLVVFGGATGGGSLSNDDLYLLDYRDEDRPEWVAIPVGKGPTPGKRYGHTMVFHKPVLIVYGGNNGTETMSDIWILDVDRSPFLWNKVDPVGGGKPAPVPRAYHSADVCREGPATGMMVVFGGRTADNQSLSDAWGLRQHRDGRWDWVEAPTKKGEPPEPRFQHVAVFAHTKFIIVGGRSGDVSRSLATCVYDTEQCEWREIPSVQRFRHATWMLGPLLFTYGGFNHVHPSAPTNDLQLLDIERALGLVLPRAAAPPAAATEAVQQQQEEAGPAVGYDAIMAGARVPQQPLAAQPQMDYPYQGPRPPSSGRSSSLSPSLREGIEQQQSKGTWGPIGAPALADKVYIASERDSMATVHQVGLDALGEESKRIRPPGSRPVVTPTRTRQMNSDEGSLHHFVIEQLLRPESWQPDVDPNRFILQPSEVRQLCKSVLQLLRKQPMVLKLRAPIKVYGDIHGQFMDLMRLFQRYAAPTDGPGGDIETMDYLFLGDYVDRGSFSLETICLLLALKIEYPNQIHLIRGNHEDPAINSSYGFRDECKRRLRDDVDNDPNCSWAWFNKVFEWMPCGAVIEDRILCIHGGIGGSIDKVEQIAKLERPLVVAQQPMSMIDQQVTDLLWSDPTDSDDIFGVTSNETRDPDGSGHIVKFGPDRVVQFLEENAPLTMIIRAHECVMDGFERFADGRLITLFSATDYCGHHKNAGALLFIRRDLTIVPKLIYPVDRANIGFGAHDTPPPPGAGSDMQHLRRMQPNWDASITSARPPTPPRPSRDLHPPPGSHPYSHNHPQESIPLPSAAWA
ncbi:serine threonine-protein phosphatase [Perkinsus olseni]|uniref:Serine/threonine-protein phosphatase n=2 Tax=Perkinsus olseni TaxID=32597 RepID=A0A7J6P6L9_PEROL|nr:serine threonine-protein phosphatase [Perkinsus olseni]